MRSRWPSLVLCLLAAAAHYQAHAAFTIDDAAISFSYARNLATGHGLGFVYPSSARADGYSNFLWVLMLAGASALGMSPYLAAKLLGLAFSLAGAATLHAVAWETLRHRWLCWGASLLPIAFPAALWSASGLETALFVFLLLQTLSGLVAGSREGRIAFGSTLPLLGLALTRPEGPVYWLASLAHHLVAPKTERERGPAGRRCALATWAAAFLLGFGAYLVWHRQLFAYWLPNTAYAKIREPLPVLLLSLVNPSSPGWRYVRGFFLDEGAVFLLPAAILGGLFCLRGPLRALPLMAAAALALPLASPDWMVHYRFMVPLLPILVLLWLVGIDRALGDGRPHSSEAGLGRRLVAPILALTAIPFVARSVYQSAEARARGYANYDTMEETRAVYEPIADLARAIGVEKPLVLAVDLGATTYELGLRLLDGAGLGDPQVAHSGWDPRVLERYLFVEQRPDFVHIGSPWTEFTGALEMSALRCNYLLSERVPFSNPLRGSGFFQRLIRKDLLVSIPAVRSTLTEFGGFLRLERMRAPLVAAPGHAIPVELYWSRIARTRREARVRARLLSPTGDVAWSRIQSLGYGAYPVARWTDEEVVRHFLRVPIPELEGSYALEIDAVDDANRPIAGVALRRDLNVCSHSAQQYAEERLRAAGARVDAREFNDAFEDLWLAESSRAIPEKVAAAAAQTRQLAAEERRLRASNAISMDDPVGALAAAQSGCALLESRNNRGSWPALARTAETASEAAGNSGRTRHAYLFALAAWTADPSSAHAGRLLASARRRYLDDHPPAPPSDRCPPVPPAP